MITSFLNWFCFRRKQQEEEQQDGSSSYSNLRIAFERVWVKFSGFDCWAEEMIKEQIDAIDRINELIDEDGQKYYKLSFILEEYDEFIVEK